MDSFWTQLIALILTPVSVIAVGVWLARSFLQHGLARDLETFRSQLQLQTIEFQTRFSVIHQKRAEVIGQLYERLVKAADRLSELVSTTQGMRGLPLSEKRKEVARICQEASDYFEQHRIYLDEDLCAAVNTVVGIMSSAFRAFVAIQRGDEYKPDDTGLWQRAWDQMSQNLQPLKRQLEERFREMLGARRVGGKGVE